MALFSNDSATASSHSSPSPEEREVRLGNPMSDDSLLLDDGCVMDGTPGTPPTWADSGNEPATFCVGNSTSNFSSQNNLDLEWRNTPGDWHSNLNHSALSTNSDSGVNGVYNISTQMRLSLTGDEADMPLLASERAVHGNGSQHCHTSSLVQTDDMAWKRLLAAAVLCLLFMVAEVVGGYFAGSLAIMTDAAHLLSDFVGLLVSLSAVWLGKRPPTRTLSFGFHRAEVLGALFSIVVIWVLTGIFVYVAIQRVLRPDFNISVDAMMVVAGIGVVINIVMGLVLHGSCPSLSLPHAHLHSHSQHQHLLDDSADGHEGVTFIDHRQRHPMERQNDGENARPRVVPPSGKKRNINVRAAAIHVLGDLIQSIGVFIAAVVIKFNPGAKMADPICSFLFSIIVLATTLPLLRDTGLVLLEGFPRGIDYPHVVAVLQEIPGVKHVHSLHVWSLTLGKHAMSVHLAVDSSTDWDSVMYQAQKTVRHMFGIMDCTIQIERFNLMVMHSCMQCQPLHS